MRSLGSRIAASDGLMRHRRTAAPRLGVRAPHGVPTAQQARVEEHMAGRRRVSQLQGQRDGLLGALGRAVEPALPAVEQRQRRQERHPRIVTQPGGPAAGRAFPEGADAALQVGQAVLEATAEGEGDTDEHVAVRPHHGVVL